MGDTMETTEDSNRDDDHIPHHPLTLVPQRLPPSETASKSERLTSCVTIIGDYQRLVLRLGRDKVAHAIVRLAAGVCAAFQNSTSEDVRGATAVIWTEVDPLSPHQWMFHVESSVDEPLLRHLILPSAPAMDGWTVVSGGQRSASSLPAFGYRQGEWVLYLVEAERPDGSSVRSALIIDWDNAGAAPGLQTFPEIQAEGRRFVFRDTGKPAFIVRWAESVRPGAGYLVDEVDEDSSEPVSARDVRRDWARLTHADLDLLRAYESPQVRATVTELYKFEERSRQGPYTVAIFPRGGNPEETSPDTVGGFQTLEDASEYCRRFVRAHVETFRSHNSTPAQVVAQWKERGLDAHVECGLFFGCDMVEEWAATPASPGEIDFEAVPRRTGLVLALADAPSPA